MPRSHIDIRILAVPETEYRKLEQRYKTLQHGVPNIHAMLRADKCPEKMIDDLAFALGVDGAARLAALWYAQDIGGLLDSEERDDDG